MKYNKSHLTHFINRIIHKSIRWCTPSIDLKFSQVKTPYASDGSIAFESWGFPSDPSGVFKKIYEHAAAAYGADHTLFSVNGTTGSNFMVLRAFSKQIPNLKILAERNIHKSIIVACEDYDIDLVFLEPNIDQEHQLFLPNSEEQIYEGIEKTNPHVLLLTNPTYEGVCLDLKKIISTIRGKYPELIVFVDEAWGAHLHFSNKLPTSAMEAGADICVQSTHKQGGSLQQSGMIHWKDGRINNDLIFESFQALVTTSPSYLLLASLDSARENMERNGKKRLEHMLTLAKRFSTELDRIKGFKVVSTESLKKTFTSVCERDETKVLLDVEKSGYSGYEIMRILEKRYNIVVEVYTSKTLLFLVPFRATLFDVKATMTALRAIVSKPKKAKEITALNLKIPTNIPKVLEFHDVNKLPEDQIEKVPLADSVGRISAEYISTFPPGIPTTIKGEEFTKEIVEYYLKLKTYPSAHITASDKSLQFVKVIKSKT